jgi:hypothetical protein
MNNGSNARFIGHTPWRGRDLAKPYKGQNISGFEPFLQAE